MLYLYGGCLFNWGWDFIHQLSLYIHFRSVSLSPPGWKHLSIIQCFTIFWCNTLASLIVSLLALIQFFGNYIQYDVLYNYLDSYCTYFVYVNFRPHICKFRHVYSIMGTQSYQGVLRQLAYVCVDIWAYKCSGTHCNAVFQRHNNQFLDGCIASWLAR